MRLAHISVAQQTKQARALWLGLGLVLTAACSDAGSTSPPATPTATSTPSATAVVRPLNPAPIMFPDDDAAHAALTEWWYYNGHLQGAAGERYGFHLVVFKRQSTPEAARATYVGHLAVTDHQRGDFQFAQQLTLPPPSERQAGRFDVTAGDIKAAGGGGADRILGSTEGYGLELQLAQAKPPVIHGDAGLVGVDASEMSYYYSRTRMQATGTLLDHGRSLTVTGLVWMDHQWGDFSLQHGGGWDWFSLQLEDNTDVMVSILRDATGRRVAAYGTYVDTTGQALPLAAHQIQAEAIGVWQSATSRARYPVEWALAFPGQQLEIRLEPVVQDQEMTVNATIGQVYWEGDMRVIASRAGQPVGGLAYMELTGYEPTP